jgi:hypothetical protein
MDVVHGSITFKAVPWVSEHRTCFKSSGTNVDQGMVLSEAQILPQDQKDKDELKK